MNATEFATKAGLIFTPLRGEGARTQLNIAFGDGTSFILDAAPAGTPAALQEHVTAALVGLRDLVGKTTATLNDNRLSEIGKAEKLLPTRTAALRLVAEGLGGVDAAREQYAAARERRYAPPQAEPTNVLGALRAWEIRDFVRAGSMADAATLVQRFTETGVGAEVLTAILASPIGVADGITEFARHAWQEHIDQRDPAGLAELKAAFAGADWAERALATIAARVRTVARLPDETVAELVSGVGRAGWRVLGFDASDIRVAKLRVERRTAA